MKRTSLCLLAVLASLQLNSCVLVPFSEGIGGGDAHNQADSSDPASEGPEVSVPPVVCGSHTCKEFKLSGLFDLPACCPPDSPSTCGNSVSEALGLALGLPPGCHVPEAPGLPDATCPELVLSTGFDETAVWAGCRRATGACGALVDLTSVDGPDFGCVMY